MSVEADTASVEQLLSDWDQAFNANSREQIFSLVTDDFELLPPDQTPVQGERARELLEAFLEFDLSLEMSVVQLVVSGDWAFSRYEYTMTLTPKTNGETSVLAGNGLQLMRRGPGGVWKFAKVMWSEER
jgi:ketosteroid isomerase-like protein